MFLRLYPTDKLVYLPFESSRIEALVTKLQTSKKSNDAEKGGKMAFGSKGLAGPGYIILNGIRVLNIIGFIAVSAASVVLLVKIDTDTNLFFFDAVSHVITLITSMFLLVSELSLFRGYFARNWPLLSPSHGFVTLALAMVVLGINMIGNLNKTGSKLQDLGLPFWRVVISSGIIIFIMGWINLLASYVFRDRKHGITARQVRAKGAANHKTPILSEGSSTPPAPVLAQSYIPNPLTPSPTKTTKNSFNFFASERRQSQSGGLPSYHTASSTTDDRPISPTSKYSRLTTCTKKKVFGAGGLFGRDSRQSLAPPLPINPQQGQREMEISAPMGVNPQFAHLVQRPDSALHPSRTGESQAFRWGSRV